MAGSRKTSKSLIYAKPPSKGELMRISASSTRRVCFRARTWLDQDQLFGSDDCAGLCSGAERGERVLGAIVMTMCPKLSSQSTLRWREMDSNPRSPVRRTTLFETPLSPTCARATAAFEKRSPPRPAAASSSCRSRSDERRTHSPTRRSSGPPQPPPPPPLRFNHRVVLLPCPLISCSCAVALSRGRASTLANRLIFGAQFRPWELLLAFDDQQGDGLSCAPARLAPAMISTLGHRVPRRRQRGAPPALAPFGADRP